MRKLRNVLGVALVAVVAFAGTAFADFSPQFSLKVSDKKVKGNPALDIHLEFDADDEEIGGGSVTIEAGLGCRPGPEGDTGATAPVTLDATIYERVRTDEEADAGVHAVWLLDLEPLNRVRLLVTGSKKSGWHIEGAPTPSDNTCNPLIVDLTINDKSASGVALVTNPKTPGKYKVKAQIVSQDSAAVAKFTEKFKITK